MFRETCPDDLDDVDLRRRPAQPPGLFIIILPIGLGLVTLVLVAALHSALGSPLGADWAAEVWSMIKAAIWPTIACASLGLYVRRQHAPMPSLEGHHSPRSIGPHTGGHPRLSTGGHRVIQIELTDADENSDDGSNSGWRGR